MPELKAKGGAGLPPLFLHERADGSRELAARRKQGGSTGTQALAECHATFSPRGVAAVVKGPPWLPMDKFHLEASLSREDFEWLRSAGINVIRLGAMWPGLMPDPPLPDGGYRINASYVEGLQRIVEQAADAGIYTLLEFHQDTLSEQFCGEGMPLWLAEELREAFPRDFPEEVVELVRRSVPHAPGLEGLLESEVRATVTNRIKDARFPAPLFEPFPMDFTIRPPYGVISQETCNSVKTGYMMWTDFQLSFAAGHAFKQLFNVKSKTFQHLLQYWRVITEAFKGNPNILAFDLFNEPWPGSFFTEPWMMIPSNFAVRMETFYQHVAELVHGIDPDRLILFSPPQIEEANSVAPLLNWPGRNLCPRLASVFGGLLQPLVDSCEILWDLQVWMPSDGFVHTAFEKVPLENQSILGFHYYRPPQASPDAYSKQRLGDVQRLHSAGMLTETCCMDWPFPGLLQDTYWFERSGAGWIIWEYKPQATGWPKPWYGSWRTGVGPDMFDWGTGKPFLPRWRTIAHPSAQFVAGDVVTNVFESWHGRFNLTFRPEQRCGDDGAWDAVVLWPGGWWTDEGKDAPIITVSPSWAVNVSEVPWFPTTAPPRTEAPLLRTYGVRVTAQVPVVSVVMDFQKWDFSTELKSWPVVETPAWWQGSGWLLIPLLLAVVLAGCVWVICRLCCCLCCRSKEDDTQTGYDEMLPGGEPPSGGWPAGKRSFLQEDLMLGLGLPRLLRLQWDGKQQPSLARPLLDTNQGP